jgi:hypothetical protein
VVLNGTAPQLGSLHLTGSATVGALVAPTVELGPGAAERLDATIVGALTAGPTSNADAYHAHDASALTGTLSSAALPSDVARLTSGKLPAEALPASVPLLDASGKLGAATLPASIPLLDGGGTLPESTIPASVARAADVYTRSQVDGSFLTQAAAAAGYAAKADVASLWTGLEGVDARVFALENPPPEPARSLTLSQNGVAPGQCVSLAHGWNTTAVLFGAWERRAGGTMFVPVAPVYDDGTIDAARAAVVTTSSGAGAPAVDGDPATQWEAETGVAWLQLDFGRPRVVKALRIRPSRSGSADTTTMWWLSTSNDGVTFSYFANGSCVPGSTCDQVQTFNLEGFTRYLRIDVQGVAVATMADLEAYGEHAAIEARPNEVRVCNYDQVAKDYSLAVTR